MDIKIKLDQAIQKWDLLRSPFYQAWVEGTLSLNDLRLYASEYGAFISLLPLGWKTLDDEETEQEEKEHCEMWRKFAESIDAIMNPPRLADSKTLLTRAKKLFSDRVSAIGAMYALEVQQPGTAQSKLKGLEDHYSDCEADKEYFEAHSHNEHEAGKLLQICERLSDADQHVALKACEKMCAALWDALDSIYSTAH